MLRFPRAAAAVAVLVLGAFAAAAAQTAQRSSTGPKPLIPAAASSIASNPDAYYGQNVTVIAAVDRLISENAFTIDQDRKASTGEDVLVLVPSLSAPVELNAYVTVMGEVVRFPPQELSIALPADIVSKYRGRPAILATSVLNAALIDLAKRPPPPLTPEEEAYDKVMKRVSPAFAALRQAVTDSNTEAVKLQATQLKLSFIETEAFWKTRQKPDAEKWAVEARGYAEAIERAAGAARSDDLKAAVTGLQQSCSSCHAAYRERLDDGSYRIRGER